MELSGAMKSTPKNYLEIMLGIFLLDIFIKKNSCKVRFMAQGVWATAAKFALRLKESGKLRDCLEKDGNLTLVQWTDCLLPKSSFSMTFWLG